MANKTSSENVSTSPYDVLTRQYVSDPIPAQTINGTVKGQIRSQEANADADYCRAIIIKVVSNDGTVERGTLLSHFPDSLTSEYGTSLANRNFPPETAVSEVVAQANDRIVIEVGTRSFNEHTTSRNATHSFGDNNATDLPENETTTATNNPWIEFSQVLAFTITYDAPTNTVTVLNGYDVFQCSCMDIYNADVAGGWGKVSFQGTSQFLLDCRLRIGDGTILTWFADSNKQLLFADGIVQCLRVENNASLTLGVLEDATTKTTSQGCSIFSAEVDTEMYLVIGKGGAFNLYSCQLYSATSATNAYVSVEGATAKVYNCLYTRQVYNQVLSGTLDLYNTAIQKAYYGHMKAGSDIVGLRVTDVTRAFYLEDGTGKLINCYARRCTYLIRTWNLAYDRYLINMDTDTWAILWGGTTVGNIYRQYEFDLTVTDYAGTPLENATVTLKDKDNNTVFSLTTSAIGAIATQTVSRGYYTQATGDTLQEYSPHTLTVTKTGYIPITRVFTLSEKTKWMAAMHAQLDGTAEPEDVATGETFFKDDADAKQTGTHECPVTELTGDANPEDVLKDKTFYKDNAEEKLTGTLKIPTVFINVDGKPVVNVKPSDPKNKNVVCI